MALKRMGDLGLAEVTTYYSSFWRRLLNRKSYFVSTRSKIYRYDNYKKAWL